jgi:putative transcriptional regulator
MTRDVFDALLDAARARRRRRLGRLARLVGLALDAALPSSSAEAIDVKAVRALTGLSQPKFAELLGIELGTLRNWEQGRRAPTGPGRALLRAIRNDPIAVIKALSA